MRYVLIALALLLAGCDDNTDSSDYHSAREVSRHTPSENCKQLDAWLERDVTNRADLQKEINDLISSKERDCGGINAYKLNKVLSDLNMLGVPPSGGVGMSGECPNAALPPAP